MSNMLTRALTGTVFIVVVIGSILLNQYTMAGLFLIFAIVGLIELLKINGVETKQNLFSVGVLAFVIYFIITQIGWGNMNGHTALICFALMLIPLLKLPFNKVEEKHLKAAIITTFGLIYIVVPFALANSITRYQNQDATLLIAFFAMLWANDTFAYLTGKFLGKHKLIEHVSPKKTWEGFIGGVVFTMVVAFFAKNFVSTENYSLELTQVHWLVLGFIVSVTATIGDLIQSYMKRVAGVKDAGNIFPGHGGVLDRFDGYLIALPAMYCFLKYFM